IYNSRSSLTFFLFFSSHTIQHSKQKQLTRSLLPIQHHEVLHHCCPFHGCCRLGYVRSQLSCFDGGLNAGSKCH
ncbi:hypothetical protein BCR41DRAFT_419227, partial [Lobosporangium transversale]